MNATPAETPSSAGLRLRPMRETDLADIQRLERLCQPAPWPAWFFRRQLRRNASCWVLEAGDNPIGFGIVALFRQRAHIMNMCIEPGRRRRGLGRRVLLHLLHVARQHHCSLVWLEVRPTNRPAILLYRQLGFRTRAVRKGFYPTRSGRQNALMMARSLRRSGGVRRTPC